MGLQKRRASVAAALAGRWHSGRRASPNPRDCQGTRDDSMAVRGRGRLIFPPAKAAVRAWPMAGKAKASSVTALRTPLVCHWRQVPRPPMGMSAPKSSRCWIACISAPANGVDRANDSRSWRRIRGMMPKTFANASASAGSAPRFPNGCGSAASRGGAH
jgi:hypothetical protein